MLQVEQELLMLVLEVMVIKILNGISMEFMECLNEGAKKKKKKKGHFLYIGDRAIQIATGSNLLDTKYEFYGFNDDLRETIN